MRARLMITLLVGLLSLSMVLAPTPAAARGEQPAQAAGTVIRVTTTRDEIQENNACSLREAVLSANQDLATGGCPAGNGVDIIQVPGGYYNLTIPGSGENDGLTGDLDIWENVEIQGAGSGVTGLYMDMDYADRFFQIHIPSTTVVISDMRMSGGNIQLDGASSPDAGGGAIHNLGTLRLDNTIFYWNRVVVTNAPAVSGGAIFNGGTLEAVDSRFERNESAEKGGAIYNQGELFLDGVEFFSNQGGAIENAASGTAIIANSLFRENGQANPEEYGPQVGAVEQYGEMEIYNTVFSQNKGREVGAIKNAGSLLIEDSTIAESESDEGPAGIHQAGGRLIIRRSSFIANRGGFSGGGLVIENAETVLVEDSYFARNTNYHGGGIRQLNGPTTIINTTIADNGAYTGAGIEINGEGVRIIGSTISGNSAGEEGGGIFSRGSFILENSTVTENNSYDAGGMYLSSGNALISYSTITRNRRGGIRAGSNFAGVVQVQASIIAENYDNDEDPKLRDCITEAGGITSLGMNLVGTTGECNFLSAESDILGSDSQPVDPELGPLRNNGGTTMTHALQPGSPALDAAGSQNCPETDQRGIQRPQGSACDIGSFEEQAPEPVIESRIYLPGIVR